LAGRSGTISFAGRRHYLGFLDAERGRGPFDNGSSSRIERPTTLADGGKIAIFPEKSR
jgi:hypothetical protein